MASNRYFSHDSNSRNSDKLLQVRMKYGAEGYGIFFMILERLREEKEYMSVKDYNMVAFDLRVDTSKIKAVVEDFGLFVFTDDGEYFYSESFNERMAMMDEKKAEKSERGKKAAAARWEKEKKSDSMHEQCMSNADAMHEQCKPMPNKLKENKLNQNKTKETHTKERARAHDASLADFDVFWQRFPNKIHQVQAASVWTSMDFDNDLVPAIMAGLERWLASDQWSRGVYQSPVTWLRDKLWMDEPPPRRSSDFERKLDSIDEWLLREEENDKTRIPGADEGARPRLPGR